MHQHSDEEQKEKKNIPNAVMNNKNKTQNP